MGAIILYLTVILFLFLDVGTCNGTTSSNGTKLTRELIPLEGPTNLTLQHFDDREAIITWDPVKPDSVRGTFRGYIVRVWNHGLSQVYAVPPEVTKASVAFFPYSKNFVTVAVRNDKYVGPRSETISFEAPQTEPGMPFLFQQSQLGSHSALLQWSRPSNPNGVLLGYNLYCSEATESGINDKTKVHEFIQGAENTQAKITGLKLGQKYQVEVAAVNCAGEGEHNSLSVEVEPHQPYPPSPPSFKYKINHENLEKNEYFHRECTKPRYPYIPHKNIVDIDHVEDDTFTLDHADPKKPADNPQTTTNPPQNITEIKSRNPCLVQTEIKWVPDTVHNPGEYFYLKYRQKGSQNWTETLPELSEDFLIINEFNACKRYEIVLVAVDGEYRTESEPQETPATMFM
ncbi:neuroglian-like [Anthonomus grandis grandis]|uniref:neuroglian-like n=1 Tax=Anthonomus grandis grandis TaxID=2921223 RepID=UPI00216561F6|nr:neuroglian-like [Anthonomus grandis grandis]